MTNQDKQMTQEFSEGWSARVSHKALSACPFEKDTQQASLWFYGFYEASRDAALTSEEMGE